MNYRIAVPTDIGHSQEQQSFLRLKAVTTSSSGEGFTTITTVTSLRYDNAPKRCITAGERRIISFEHKGNRKAQ